MVILSHGLWLRSFGADPAIVGRTINLGGGQAQIVGVLAPDFELLFPPRANLERVPDAWTAMRIDYAAANRNNVGLRVVARMKPGVSVEHASAEVERLSAELRKQFPIKQTSGLHFRAVSIVRGHRRRRAARDPRPDGCRRVRAADSSPLRGYPGSPYSACRNARHPASNSATLTPSAACTPPLVRIKRTSPSMPHWRTMYSPSTPPTW